MTQKITDFFELFLFSLFSLWIYTLFILTIPIGEDTHGWIALNGFDKPTWLGTVHWFIFGSALICSFLGVIMMRWMPVLSPDVVRNHWVVTYFFIWIDTVFSLSIEYQTVNFLIGLLLGMFFIFLFFYLLQTLGYVPKTETYIPDWKSRMIHYWTWGWMSFYFTLSFLMVYNSYKYTDSRWPFSFGALIICFLNYVFLLFLERAEGRDIEGFSKRGRLVFGIWSFLLIVCTLGEKWLF